MTRLRYNGLRTTLGSSLSSSATSVTFAAALTYNGGTNVPTISGSDYVPLSLLDTNGVVKEVVYLTAYTSGAMTGTIARGKEGTTGTGFGSGTSVVHAPTVGEFGGRHWRFRTGGARSFPAAWTALAWGVEDSDPDDCHSTSTNPTRWTAPVDGTYLFVTALCYDGSGAVYFQYGINGTREPGRILAPSGGNCATVLTRTFSLSAGDYVEFFGYSSNGDGTTKSLADDESVFTVARIGW